MIARDGFEVFVDKRILAREKWRDEINGLWPDECRLRQPRSNDSRRQSRYGGVPLYRFIGRFTGACRLPQAAPWAATPAG